MRDEWVERRTRDEEENENENRGASTTVSEVSQSITTNEQAETSWSHMFTKRPLERVLWEMRRRERDETSLKRERRNSVSVREHDAGAHCRSCILPLIRSVL